VSKAFKTDDAPDELLVVPPRPPLPAGVPNYVTPRGLAALRAERLRLVAGTEPVDGWPGDDRARAASEASLALRLRALDERIAGAVVVDTAGQAGDRVRFGARVTVRAADAIERTYEIVGLDEADVTLGRIAFVAPLARALLGKSPGDVVTLRSPRGDEELEILDVVYRPPAR
jgi:transcription elongation factor GreB